MRIGIFDPYLDTLGGGEKYIFDLASCLSNDNSVYIFWDDSLILQKAEERFGKKLDKFSLAPNIFSKKTSLISKYRQTSMYDFIFYMSDGSIPFLFAKKNVLIFQFPIPWVKKTWLSNLKLKNINEILCYSNFVKDSLDKTLRVNSMVLSPMVESSNVEKEKEKIILTVGRFTKAMNQKKQEVLIEAFKKMVDEGLKAWRFVLIGSVLPSDLDLVEKLEKLSKNYPIQIITNATRKELLQFYGKAMIYWHATGYGENINQNPQLAEHFGISTVEAMSFGAVPVVINKGGQKEIVDEKSGFLWESKEELIKNTKRLIENKDMFLLMSKNAHERSKIFTGERFCKELKKIINEI